MKNIDSYLKELGPGYSIQIIDMESVIYHKINEYYDIEISGLDNRKKNPTIVIYVWQIFPVKRIIETVNNINSVSHLVDTLAELRLKYSAEKPPG